MSGAENDSPTRNPWVTHSQKPVYENPWIRVTESQVTTPGGSPGIYGVVHYQNRAVGIVAVDEQDHTWLVGQYRYPTETYEWEIPEGGAPFDESLEDCAHRELAEETGLQAGKLELLLGDLQLSNSVSDERAYLYVARELTVGKPHPEDTEQIRVRRLPLTETFAMIDRGEIRDAMTIIALQSLRQRS